MPLPFTGFQRCIQNCRMIAENMHAKNCSIYAYVYSKKCKGFTRMLGKFRICVLNYPAKDYRMGLDILDVSKTRHK